MSCSAPAARVPYYFWVLATLQGGSHHRTPHLRKAEMPLSNRFDSCRLSRRDSCRLSRQERAGISFSTRLRRSSSHSRRPPGSRPKEETSMFKTFDLSRIVWPGLALAGALVFSAQPVFAGECPADKMKPNARQMVDYKPVGVTDVTLGSIDLGKQPAHIEGRELRFRK